MKKSIRNIVQHSQVSEKAIEKYFCQRMKEFGYPCLKYSNPGMVGYPDRLVVLPCANVVWVELKSDGKKPSKLQELRHKELESLKHVVWVIDSKQGVDELASAIETWKADNKEIREAYPDIEITVKSKEK